MFEEILIFCTFGILAGLLAGMFGIGGGLIMVPVLIGTFMNLGFNSEIIVQLAIGTSIGCIIFTSISSAVTHNNKGSVNLLHFKPVATGIVFGAFAGAFLGGYFFDTYGSYDYAWYMAIALSIFATIVHYPIDETRLVRVDNTL